MKILPVIHVRNPWQAVENARIAQDAGIASLFLIAMDGDRALTVASAKAVKQNHPRLKVGINLLGASALETVQTALDLELEMSWTDLQLTHSQSPSDEIQLTADLLRRHPLHDLFAGVAFKHQPHEPRPDIAAAAAIEHGFVPTTSGPRTGQILDDASIKRIRTGLEPEDRLAIASGVTPENAASLKYLVTDILIATGINTDTDDICPKRLAALVRATR